MPELVGQNPELVLALLDRRHEREHRVFHAFDEPLDRRRMRPRVCPPRLAEVLDREPRHLVRVLPRRRTRPVEGLNQDAVPAGRIPPKVRRRGPRDVADVAGGEVPGLAAGGALCAVRGRFRFGHDLHGLGGGARPGETRALLGGPHRDRVRRRAGRRHQEPRRERERDIEVAVLEIELAGADVRQGVPAVHVVVHDQAGIPLADLVQPRADPSHAAAAVGRDREVPRDVEVDRASGRQRTRQLDTHHGAVLRARERLPAGGKALDRDAADEPLPREVEHGAAREVERRLVQHVGDAVGREDVLLDLHPHERERVGRVVRVVDPLGASDRLGGRVQRRVDHVIRALLPIVRSRRPGRAADPARRRQRQCAEGGGIGHGRLQRQRSGGQE